MRYADLRCGVRDAIGDDRRFAHSIRVARLAERLAVARGVEARRARLAGMLHDLARLWPAGRLLAECRARGVTIDAHARANPIVLHAPLGAELARERFGVDDEGVLEAIRRHTLASPAMSPLDAVLYLADALEPGRAFPERAALEALAFADPDAALRAVLESTMRYLQGRGLSVAPVTEHAYRAALGGNAAV